MTDTLKSGAPIAGLGPNLSFLGLTTLVDNHGNKLIRNEITCAGKKPLGLSSGDIASLQVTLWPYAFMAPIPGGNIPLHGAESPLQWACHQLEAEHATVPAALGHKPARVKSGVQR